MFTELGWNNSVAEQIAQLRVQRGFKNKDWGAMITWKYDQAPYLDSGDEIYNQMLTSYEAGAKYIAVFNYPYVQETITESMTDDQFIALQRFWNDITQKKFTI